VSFLQHSEETRHSCTISTGEVPAASSIDFAEKLGAISGMHVMSLVWRGGRSKDDRQAISRVDLQLAIAEAVRKFDPVCENFVDVIIQRQTPKSNSDANWNIKGVKFGQSDRAKSNQAIETIVARMQREFVLAADPSG
jgi:hypothetical protein